MNSYALWMIAVLVINLLIAMAGLFVMRALQGLFVGVSAKQELDETDNLAFGISFAGAVIALCWVLSAAVSGEAAVSLSQEAFTVLVYALGGIVLLKLGLVIQDTLVLTQLSLPQQIKRQNNSAGIISAANLIATGIVIHSVVQWIVVDTWQGVLALICVFLAMQAVLFAVVQLRAWVYRRRHQGQSWQQALLQDNPALAMRYAGQLVGTALAIGSVGSWVIYTPDLWWLSVGYWLAYALAMLLGLWLLYRLLCPAVLTGIDRVEEVDRQRNLGVALVEAAIFIGLAMLLRVLFI